MPPGEVFGLLGPERLGQDDADPRPVRPVAARRGSATVLGHDVARERRADPRQSIGYMSQKFSLYADLTARENMDFYAGIYGLLGSEPEQRQAGADRADRPRALPRPPGGPALRRLEAAAGPGLRPAAPAAAGLPRRADRRHRPGGPPRPVGPAVPARRPRASRCSSPRTTWTRPSAAAGSATCYLSKLLVVGTPDELKELPEVTPPGTRRLEIVGPDTAGLLARLREQPGVREATIFGQSIHALVDDDR